MASPVPTDVTQLAAAVAALAGKVTVQATEIVTLRAEVSRVAVAQAAEVAARRATFAALSATVTGLDREAGRSILGAEAYDSTAFLVSLFVAAYQFIPDPTGDQDATELSDSRCTASGAWPY